MARVFPWTAVAFILVASPALAQGARPPVELGLGVSSVPNHDQGDFGIPSQPPGVDIRVTIPASPRFALEVGTSVGIQDEPRSHRVTGYYTIQVKQAIVRGTPRGFQPFVTYGAVGGFQYHRFARYDYQRSDGGIGHFGGRSFTDIGPPLLAAVGGGLQQQLGSHVAIRADAQLLTLLWIPLGARFTASISLPIGRSDRK